MGSLRRALPFWASLLLVPLAILAAWHGGWSMLALPVATWHLFAVLDHLGGDEEGGMDPETPKAMLGWYRLVTLVWFPLQFGLTFGLIHYVVRDPTLAGWEKAGIFFGVGVLSGTIGVNYAHELLHRKSRAERWLADLLLALVFYSHFRSEHLLVHHRFVATPRDPATARYNEGFHRFYPRVLVQSLRSAVAAETATLDRAGRTWWHRSNPFWRYGMLQAGFAALALLVGGTGGLGLLLLQAGVAIWQVELVNYVEHYGLRRRPLGRGRYEAVRPHHSWNATRSASNKLLINLQLHSDHHCRPDRHYPLLQSYDETEAPRLPAGYPAMTALAMVPPLWRRVMNPRVRAWRRRHYPDITDWSDEALGSEIVDVRPVPTVGSAGPAS